MFVAMFCSLPIYFLIKNVQRCCITKSNTNNGKKDVLQASLLLHHHGVNDVNDVEEAVVEHNGVEETEDPGLSTRLFFLLLVPAVFDLLGTALAKVGLMYCDVSTYQLVRCTVIVFTAIAKQCLGQRLPLHVWAGVSLITSAMILVSAASLIEAADSATPAASSGLVKDPKIGIIFLMFSCMVASLQYVFEEKVMSEDGAHPLIVVGMEGFWGIVLFVCTVFPWAYILPGNDVGSLENVYDSYVMAKSSAPLQIALLGFFGTVMLYNIMAVYLTHLMSSVWHAILDCFRPVSVWGTDLLIFYVISNGAFGEAWTNWSYIELAGMLLLFFGTAVFNGNVVLKCCPPMEEEEEEEEDKEENDMNQFDPSNPHTPIYFVPGGGAVSRIDAFHTPRTRTQNKPKTPTSTVDFCRSPLLSRSAARREYQKRTVVGFSRWVGGGVVSSNAVIHSGLGDIGVRCPMSDPTTTSRLYRQQKEFNRTHSGSVDEAVHVVDTTRAFGREISNNSTRN